MEPERILEINQEKPSKNILSLALKSLITLLGLGILYLYIFKFPSYFLVFLILFSLLSLAVVVIHHFSKRKILTLIIMAIVGVIYGIFWGFIPMGVGYATAYISFSLGITLSTFVIDKAFEYANLKRTVKLIFLIFIILFYVLILYKIYSYNSLYVKTTGIYEDKQKDFEDILNKNISLNEKVLEIDDLAENLSKECDNLKEEDQKKCYNFGILFHNTIQKIGMQNKQYDKIPEVVNSICEGNYPKFIYIGGRYIREDIAVRDFRSGGVYYTDQQIKEILDKQKPSCYSDFAIF